MSVWFWVLTGILAVMFLVNFIIICPDKLPGRKRGKKK